jgi:hypothetical protein
MPFSYIQLAKKPVIFLRLTGVKVDEFKEIVTRVKPVWDKVIEAQKKCQGRQSPLTTLEDKVLALLLYYRTYIPKSVEFASFCLPL